MDYKYNKILLIDGSFIMHKTLSVDKLYEQKNIKGESTGGMNGCLRTLCKLLKMSQFKGYFPVFTWDRGVNQRRKALDENYKTQNKKVQLTPEEEKTQDEYITMYRTQRNRLIDMLSYLGIPSIILENREGDDLGRLIMEQSKDVVFVTSDKDWLQNLKENHIAGYNPIKNEYYTETKYLKDKNIESINQFLIEKIILGDTSDNIPSCCRGVGEKTVSDLYNFLKLFRINGEWNFDNYPQTIDECKALCEKNNLTYRKAYLNFDRERFATNEQLINLDYVEHDTQTLTSIDSTIELSQQQKSFIKVIKKLAEYNIKDLDTEFIRREITLRKLNLYIK